MDTHIVRNVCVTVNGLALALPDDKWPVYRLREWFASSPFYAGRPLAEVTGSGDDGLYLLRESGGRVVCAMSLVTLRKITGGPATL